MKFQQNIQVASMNEFNAGGFAHVPPTVCRLPARVSACVPAYVEPLGAAETNKLGDIGTVRPATVNCPIRFLGLIA